MGQQNVFEYIREAIRRSGIVGRLIAINTIIFLLMLIVRVIAKLYVQDELPIDILKLLAAPGNPSELIYTPWSVFTSMFTHYEFGHFFFNMLMFFFTGKIFVQYLGERRLLSTYLLGGIIAYLLHMASFYIFPAFAEQVPGYVLGASGSIMALLGAISFHRPSLKVHLFGLIPIPLIAIAILFILTDLSGITEASQGQESNIAHFAHLGGAIFGALSIIGVHKNGQFMNRFDRFIGKLKIGNISLKRKPKMKVYQGGAETKNMTDEEFNQNKKLRQEKLDAILDKIGKKGYEGLTKEEKDFLFNESQRK